MADEHDSSPVSTGTLAGALAHARSQAVLVDGQVVDAPGLDGDAEVVWSEVVEAGGYCSRRLPRGSLLRLEDTNGDACLQVLVHNAAQPAERLNIADTVKVQWQAYLAEGAQLLSDMGRVLMTIVGDTSARHDCLCGCSNRATNVRRYGDGGASGTSPNGRDLLALGVAKLGLSRLDVGPNVNLFKSVSVDAAGALHFDGALRPGTHVELRAEMDVFVTLANTPHPLDDRAVSTTTAVRCVAWLPATTVADPVTSPERERAVRNTADFLLGQPR